MSIDIDPRFSRGKLLLKGLHRVPGSIRNAIRVDLLRRRGAEIAAGAFVHSNARVTGIVSNLSVGDGSYLGPSEFYALGRIMVGNRVLVGAGCYICTGSHDFNTPNFGLKTSDVTIGDDVWVATGATILGPCKVGAGAVIGASAVVRGDVEPMGIMVGNPAQLIGKRRSVSGFAPVAMGSVDALAYLKAALLG